MKKLSLFLLVSVFALCGCGDDNDETKGNGEDQPTGDGDKKEVVISFEDELKKAESEFTTDQGTKVNPADPYSMYKYSITDPKGLVSFDHFYADWGNGYSFAGFTYMNKTSHAYNAQPQCGKAKTGTVYLSTYSDAEFGSTLAIMTINDPNYSIKGAWITNSAGAYAGMTEGDDMARPFVKGDKYTVTATGYNKNNEEIGSIEVLLADYKSNTDKPVSDWIWFDLSTLQNAVKIKFVPTSTDMGEFMNTSKYFCLDDITLIENNN